MFYDAIYFLQKLAVLQRTHTYMDVFMKVLSLTPDRFVQLLLLAFYCAEAERYEKGCESRTLAVTA